MSNKIFYILMFLAMIGWGESWISAKVLGEYLGAKELTFWRFFISAFGLIPVLLYLKISLKITSKNLLLAFVCGVILALYNQVFFLGTKHGLASFGGVMVTTLVPLVTFLFIALLHKKSFKKIEYFGLALGIFGVLIMLDIWHFNFSLIFSRGNIYFLIATLLWPILTIISSYQKDISPLVFSFYMYTFTSLVDYIFLGFQLTNIANLDKIFWLNLSLISLYGTIFSTSIYFVAVMKIGSKNASSFFFLVPLSAVLLAFIFLHENIKISLILGGFFSICAVYMINRAKNF